jgi:hypothetical protein
MNELLMIEETEIPDGPLVGVGPTGPELLGQIRVPSTIQRKVTYRRIPLVIVLDLVFSGQRLEPSGLQLRTQDGFITTQYLTGMGLPKVIRAIATKEVPDSSNWLPVEDHFPMRDASYEYLAQLYWFECLSWGSPRAAIMSYTGWSRANTTLELRKIAEKFPLPRPGPSKPQKSNILRQQDEERFS